MTTFDPGQYARPITTFLESNPDFFEGLSLVGPRIEEYIEAMDSMIAKLGIQLPAIGEDDETIDQEIDNYHEAWGQVSVLTDDLNPMS
jgi:hypothetical protein